MALTKRENFSSFTDLETYPEHVTLDDIRKEITHIQNVLMALSRRLTELEYSTMRTVEIVRPSLSTFP